VKYPTIILFEVFEITKKSGGKNEARLLKFNNCIVTGFFAPRKTIISLCRFSPVIL
jgi:hypothetical protein